MYRIALTREGKPSILLAPMPNPMSLRRKDAVLRHMRTIVEEVLEQFELNRKPEALDVFRRVEAWGLHGGDICFPICGRFSLSVEERG